MVNLQEETQDFTCFTSPDSWRRLCFHLRHMTKRRVLLRRVTLAYVSCRQSMDAALQVRYSSSKHHVQFAKLYEKQNVFDWCKIYIYVYTIYIYIHTYIHTRIISVTSVKQYRINGTSHFKHFAQLNTIHLRVRTWHKESQYSSCNVHCSHTHPRSYGLLNWRS